MSSDENPKSLDGAVDQAILELQKAKVDVSKGASPQEAFAEKVGSGPESVVHELQGAMKGANLSNPVRFMVRYGGQSQLWEVSQTGSVIVPVTKNFVSTVGESAIVGEDEKERRRRRDEMAKSGKHVANIQELAASVQKGVGVPSALAPYFGRALTPTPGYLSAIPLLVQLGAIAWLKLFEKKGS